MTVDSLGEFIVVTCVLPPTTESCVGPVSDSTPAPGRGRPGVVVPGTRHPSVQRPRVLVFYYLSHRSNGKIVNLSQRVRERRTEGKGREEGLRIQLSLFL